MSDQGMSIRLVCSSIVLDRLRVEGKIRGKTFGVECNSRLCRAMNGGPPALNLPPEIARRLGSFWDLRLSPMPDPRAQHVIFVRRDIGERIKGVIFRSGNTIGREAGVVLEGSMEADAMPAGLRALIHELAGLQCMSKPAAEPIKEIPFGGRMPDEVFEIVLKIKSEFLSHDVDFDGSLPAARKMPYAGRLG